MTTSEPLENFQRDLAEHYTLERELPRGGMSRVFVATEKSLGRQVVLKVLVREVAASLTAERFKREIAIAARLQHPNIVPLLNAGQAGSRLYYTMPLVTGESLRERLDRERPMPIDHVISILTEVASALGYAHAEGMIHRDIKPENVMFYHEHAVVLDFGIGKAVNASLKGDDRFQPNITTQRKPLGTAIYMAPEQIAAEPTMDHRVDLYALGVVAYEMITGHPPFRGATAQAIFVAHATEIPESVKRRRAEVPADLAAIVMRCLEKAPEMRPPNGEAIAASLRSVTWPTGGSGGGSRRAPGVWIPWAIAAAAVIVAIVTFVLTGRAK